MGEFTVGGNYVDPTCAIHGIKWSEHKEGRCLYCCLCFKTLTYETCHILPSGEREDTCNECAAEEEAEMKRRGLA